ncbi:Os02g0297550, partial [Oryza sativa Japonica Group]
HISSPIDEIKLSSLSTELEPYPRFTDERDYGSDEVRSPPHTTTSSPEGDEIGGSELQVLKADEPHAINGHEVSLSPSLSPSLSQIWSR